MIRLVVWGWKMLYSLFYSIPKMMEDNKTCLNYHFKTTNQFCCGPHLAKRTTHVLQKKALCFSLPPSLATSTWWKPANSLSLSLFTVSETKWLAKIRPKKSLNTHQATTPAANGRPFRRLSWHCCSWCRWVDTWPPLPVLLKFYYFCSYCFFFQQISMFNVACWYVVAACKMQYITSCHVSHTWLQPTVEGLTSWPPKNHAAQQLQCLHPTGAFLLWHRL